MGGPTCRKYQLMTYSFVECYFRTSLKQHALCGLALSRIKIVLVRHWSACRSGTSSFSNSGAYHCRIRTCQSQVRDRINDTENTFYHIITFWECNETSRIVCRYCESQIWQLWAFTEQFKWKYDLSVKRMFCDVIFLLERQLWINIPTRKKL